MDQFKAALASERELREIITEKIEDARQIKDTEILRRLDELNHAHQTAMENWARSLPRELFDQWEKDYDKWRESITTQLGTMTPLSAHLASVDMRLASIERLVNKASGAAILLGIMGLSGVVALILNLARFAGFVQ